MQISNCITKFKLHFVYPYIYQKETRSITSKRDSQDYKAKKASMAPRMAC
jgi:hypothetical protein